MNTIKLNTIGTPKASGGNSGGGGNTPSKPKWTGHADAEGLKAIGWTDEDIAYYQEHGVNWNAEDDEYHKVTDDNKALYGVLTASNISSYKERIVYLPKIDTSIIKHYSQAGASLFYNCSKLVAIPMIDTSFFTTMYNFFNGCISLVSVPKLDTSKVTNMDYTFYDCASLEQLPNIDISKVTSMSNMVRDCSKLVRLIPIDNGIIGNIDYLMLFCYALSEVPLLDVGSMSNASNYFRDNYCLHTLKLKNLKLSINVSKAKALSKESLIFIINNEAATSAITITLHSYAYTRLAEDADIVAALAAHPNISLAK